MQKVLMRNENVQPGRTSTDDMTFVYNHNHANITTHILQIIALVFRILPRIFFESNNISHTYCSTNSPSPAHDP